VFSSVHFDLITQEMRLYSVQFSSVHFDLITQEMLSLQYIGGFSWPR